MKKLIITLCAVFIGISMQSGCTHLESGKSVQLKSTDHWALLPLQNLAETPRAGEQVETILQGMLLNQGITELAVYTNVDGDDLALLLDDDKRIEKAKLWASEQGLRYCITGSVQEWHYKTGLDGEPAVGITLRILDMHQEAQPIWSSTASRTGWGAENLTETTARVLKTLLDQIELLP